MNPEKNINENEQLEAEEQSIGEPQVHFFNEKDKEERLGITKAEEAQIDLQKRMEEADQANEVEFNDNWGE